MKKKIIATALLLCCFLVGFATITSLNGKWAGVLKTDGDEYPLLYNFKIEGNQLTGTAKTPKGDLPINDGVVTGKSFSFNVMIGDMEFDHTGKFYGDSVGVDISMGEIKSHATLMRTNP